MSKTTTLIIALLCIACTSCIPLRIAPKIEDYKIKVGKRFKRHLPRQHAFIFSDPKETYDFYYYFINKYKVEDGEALHNQEFTLDEEKYYISYFDAEIPTKTINLIPILIDAKLEHSGHSKIMENAHFSRSEYWYLAITVSNDDQEDCLDPKYSNQNAIVNYLAQLKSEYLSTSNYNELLLTD